LSKKDGGGPIDAIQIAEKQRHIYLLGRVKNNQPLNRKELAELTELEKKSKITNHKSKIAPATIAAEQIIKTQAAAGKYASVSARTIRRWCKNGMPRTSDGCYIKSMLDMFRKNEGNQPSVHKDRRQKGEADIKETRAQLLEIELRIKKGELVEKEEVEKKNVRKIIVLKRKLLTLGRRIAVTLPTKYRKKIQNAITDQIRDMIDEFAEK